LLWEPAALDTPILEMTAPKAPRASRVRNWTWADAEARWPGCSAAWDRDGGHEWAADRPSLTIVIGDHLAVGCGDREPFGWALYKDNEKDPYWIFL
jgi:hypothetical protein